jgi:hypothetical protein
MAKSIARRCLDLTGLFEAELLVELMLRHWDHPLAADSTFRSDLLESAARVLEESTRGSKLFEDFTPRNVNFVVAVWYAEWLSVQEATENTGSEIVARRAWLARIRQAIPSCFCDPTDLV